MTTQATTPTTTTETPAPAPAAPAAATTTDTKKGKKKPGLAEALAAKKAAMGKGAKAKPAEVVPEVKPEEEEKEPEHTETWEALVGTLIPADKEGAQERTEEARELVKEQDQDRVKIGMIALAMGERLKSTGDEGKDKKQSRAKNNGFGAAGFKSEVEWAFSINLIEKREDGKFNENRLHQAKLAASLHLDLVQSGIEAGAGIVDRSTLGMIARSSKKTVAEVLPVIVKLGQKDASPDKIRKAVEEKIAEVKAEALNNRTEVDLKELPTENVYNRAKRALEGIQNACERQGGLNQRCAASKEYVNLLGKKADLTPAQRKEIEVQYKRTIDKLTACLKSLGVKAS